jgi:protein-disulfide isomerase
MNKQTLSMPVAIIIAGVMISAAVMYSGKSQPQTGAVDQKQQQNAGGDKNTAPKNFSGPKAIDANDHVAGSPDAPITLVVFTDLECPFCKRFDATTKQMMDDYGKQGKVRLVFRHFPLDSLHTKARTEAEATECATDQGGNDAFWKFADKIFEITPSNNGLDLTQLPKIAADLGLNKTKFEKCLADKTFAAKVQADADDAVASGAQGTPYYVIINTKGEKFPIEYGALPWLNAQKPELSLKSIIDKILKGDSPYIAE